MQQKQATLAEMLAVKTGHPEIPFVDIAAAFGVRQIEFRPVTRPAESDEAIPPAPSLLAALREKPRPRMFEPVALPEDDGPIVAARAEYVPAAPSLVEALRGERQ